MIGLAIVFAVGLVLVVTGAALAAAGNQRSKPGPWVEELCTGPCRRKHDRYQHQAETPDGACHVLNCPCEKFQP